MSDEPTYTVIAECTNCNFKAPVKVEKGTKVYMLHCPECKCPTLTSLPVHIMTSDAPVVEL